MQVESDQDRKAEIAEIAEFAATDGLGRKIVLFMGRLAPGGVAEVALSLAGEFHKRDYTVVVVVPQIHPKMRRTMPEGVQILDLGTQRILRSAVALSRYLKLSKPAAIISMTDLANVTAVLARSLSGVKCRLALSCHMALGDLPTAHRRFVHAILPFLMRATYRYADAVVAVSETVARQTSVLSGLERKRITIIDNPVNIDRVLRLSSERAEYPWPDDDIPVILSVGRLVAQKDFPTLVRAFRIVRDRMRARLAIFGEGYGHQEIQGLVASLGLEEDVWLPGFIENPFPYMRHSSVFVLPSVTEAFGLVLVEALACGSRIVATDCSEGPRNILAGGKFGTLVPPGEPGPMAEAIMRALGRDTNRERLIERALEISDPARNADAYLSLLGLHVKLDGKPPGSENRW